MNFAYPWILPAALLAVLPLIFHGVREFGYPSLVYLPKDSPSKFLRWLLRLAAAATAALLVTAAAGPYNEGGSVTRLGEGAQIVVVFDRSGSMSETLSTELVITGGESKLSAARRVLLEFMRRRPGDMFGVVAFSSTPMAVAPMTEDRKMAEAAVASAEARSMGYTSLGRGLALGLDYFRDRPFTAARFILLVSDGGAEIGPENREILRALFQSRRASLIWIYTRGVREESVLEITDESASESLKMHRFFGSLGVPYQVFEATSSQGLERAVDQVAALTNLPTRYEERLPRRNLAQPLYTAALVLITGLIIARLSEVREWKS